MPTPQFEIVDVEARPIEQNTTWWRFAWKLTLRNTGTQPVRLRGTIEFQDKDGFVIDSDYSETVVLVPGVQQTLTGFALITASVAVNVARTNAKVQATRP